jgi:hypothetical protein
VLDGRSSTGDIRDGKVGIPQQSAARRTPPEPTITIKRPMTADLRAQPQSTLGNRLDPLEPLFEKRIVG